MTTFAIIVLVVIMLGLTHLINWMWRSVNNNDDSNLVIGGFLLSVVYVFTVIIIIQTIIKWGSTLNL